MPFSSFMLIFHYAILLSPRHAASYYAAMPPFMPPPDARAGCQRCFVSVYFDATTIFSCRFRRRFGLPPLLPQTPSCLP